MINENILNDTEVISLKKSGRCLAKAMLKIQEAIKPGITTKELDQIAESELNDQGCVPSFLNYYVEGSGYYPASLCISINDEIVHGIPSKQRILAEGDVISLDLGAGYEGIYTDMAVTLVAGRSNPEKDHLINVTRQALANGIYAAKSGNHIGDIGERIESYVLGEGLEVIRDYVGHGIGRQPHMWPQIPNFGKKGKGPTICENMALAIEPMVVVGDSSTRVLENRWTVATTSGGLAAHFEHTIIIKNGKPVIVTAC